MFEGWQKAFMSNLPSMPKNFSFMSPFSSAPNGERAAPPDPSLKSKRSSLQWPQSNSNPDQNPRKLVRQRSESDSRAMVLDRTAGPRSPRASTIQPATPYRADLQRLRPQPSRLRRSTSDTSLAPQRTMSRVSSLGDDSRFEDVRDQVNSRLKAIKDSWQDSSIKLPGLPSLASFAPDFLRERSPSFNGKQSERSSRAVSPEKLTDPMTRQPYRSVKAAAADTGTNKLSTHPHFHRALNGLEGDVVVLGGYRGSILRSAEPPNRQVWVPVKVGLNLRKVDLEVGISEKDDERPSSKVIPGGMLTHIGPVDVSKRLFKRLRGCENARRGQLRVHDYGYDWRLNPLLLSKQLVAFLEGLPCNQPGAPKDQRGATVIAHSLGGLITRHAVNKRPELFRGVIYAGVPQTCVNILGPMRNGDEVLLSSRVLTAQVNFTIRTSFALLPLDGRCFIDKHDRDVEYPVDFFDPQTWIEHRLSPCVGRPLPPLSMPEKPSGLSGYVSSVTSALPSLSLSSRKNSLSRSSAVVDVAKAITVGGVATEPGTMGGGSIQSMANGNIDDSASSQESDCDVDSSLRAAVTIPREEAVAYLTRTLALVKRFKEELAFVPAHAASNSYPPVSVIYGKSTPTVYGAKVDGRDAIKHADAFDELAFASGDGVVLAKASMVPEGYTTARGGVISSERGHITLLGDLEAVGRCLNAVAGARRRGVGVGTSKAPLQQETNGRLLPDAAASVTASNAPSDNNNGYNVDFPNTIEHWWGQPVTLRERKMIDFIGTVTEQPDWQSNIFDSNVVGEWRTTLAKAERDSGVCALDSNFSGRMFVYCVSELLDYAAQHRELGFVPAVDATATVYKSDALLDTDAGARLRSSMASVESEASARQDRHHDLNEMVQDPVDPSMIPLMYGRSRVLSTGRCP
ncbi:hypothetical protein LTR53_008917 [Teratosphaeriaceae sp. CCFEE 6253]|nr:hypothetical protein LTR53_008917 [Teratosphaeriaceae sp. CCFEE 6253]